MRSVGISGGGVENVVGTMHTIVGSDGATNVADEVDCYLLHLVRSVIK